MKKLTATLLATAVATVAMPTFADTGMYVGLKGGKYLLKSDVTKNAQPAYIDDKEPSYVSGYAGYQINNNIGVEVEYGTSGYKDFTMANLKQKSSQPERQLDENRVAQEQTEDSYTNQKTAERIQHLGAYVTARYDIDTTAVPMYVKGRAGVAQTKYENEYDYTLTSVTKDVITKTERSVDQDTQKETVTTSTEEIETARTEGSFTRKRSSDKVSAAGSIAIGIKPVKKLDKLSVELEYNYLNKDIQSIGFGTQYQF